MLHYVFLAGQVLSGTKRGTWALIRKPEEAEKYFKVVPDNSKNTEVVLQNEQTYREVF